MATELRDLGMIFYNMVSDLQWLKARRRAARAYATSSSYHTVSVLLGAQAARRHLISPKLPTMVSFALLWSLRDKGGTRAPHMLLRGGSDASPIRYLPSSPGFLSASSCGRGAVVGPFFRSPPPPLLLQVLPHVRVSRGGCCANCSLPVMSVYSWITFEYILPYTRGYPPSYASSS